MTPRIRRLPPGLVDRIAAGEVIERPAAAVKELAENALDAGATRVEVALEAGGRRRIVVTDDGRGMTREELPLAVERHATSKLQGDDLLRIASLGFRGEALPSIGAVARLSLTSRPHGAPEAWRLTVDAGRVEAPAPAAGRPGTRVEIDDLFHATPARLKFLKSDRAEAEAAREAVQRLALAAPDVAFRLTIDGAPSFRCEAEGADLFGRQRARLGHVLGRGFGLEAVALEVERDGILLRGFLGLPTASRNSPRHQHLVVNGRPVRDPMLRGALRAAYADLLAGGRHPVAALFLDLDPERVDVNVHPAKAELRFREPALVRALIVSGLRRALAEHGHRASPSLAGGALAAFASPGAASHAPAGAGWAVPLPSPAGRAGLAEAPAGFAAAGLVESPPAARPPVAADPAALAHPLGAARAQLHDCYVVAETADGLVIVDQHAAHERIVHERIKAELREGGVRRQGLLLPEVVELEDDAARRLVERTDDLLRLGLAVEPFGAGAVLVRETPALMGGFDVGALVRDLADDLAEIDAAQSLLDALHAVSARLACHGSVRAGRRLAPAEQNALLRRMETTPNAGQCNHGRPTYVELKRRDIERLFGRR